MTTQQIDPIEIVKRMIAVLEHFDDGNDPGWAMIVDAYSGNSEQEIYDDLGLFRFPAEGITRNELEILDREMAKEIFELLQINGHVEKNPYWVALDEYYEKKNAGQDAEVDNQIQKKGELK